MCTIAELRLRCERQPGYTWCRDSAPPPLRPDQGRATSLLRLTKLAPVVDNRFVIYTVASWVPVVQRTEEAESAGQQSRQNDTAMARGPTLCSEQPSEPSSPA